MKSVIPKQILWLQTYEDCDNIQFLLKYAPKYYTKAGFDNSELQDGRVVMKTKRIKMVKTLAVRGAQKTQRNKVLNAFKTQKNNITTLTLPDPSVLCSFPRVTRFELNTNLLNGWRNFSKLTHLRTLTITLTRSTPHLMKYLERHFWACLPKLRNLEHLNLLIYNVFNAQTHHFLEKIDSCIPLLASLKTLSIFLNHVEIDQPFSFNYNNIRQTTTTLVVYETSFSTIQHVLSQINSFQGIESLSITKSFYIPGEDEGLVPTNFEYLGQLGNLTRLKILEISVNLSTTNNLRNFLNSFKLPKSVTNLKLNFYDACWSNLSSDPQTLDPNPGYPFDQGEAYEEFLANWEGLENLTSLSLCFIENEDENLLSFDLLAAILQRLVKLTTLFYATWSNNDMKKKRPLDLYDLIQATSHLKPYLKRVIVKASAISLRSFPPNSGRILELEELLISGFVLGDVQVSSLTSLLKAKPTEKDERSAIEIDRLVIDKKESFEELLETLTHVSRHVKVLINVDCRKIDAETFIESVCHFVPITQKKMAVKLKFCNVTKLGSQEMDRLPPLEDFDIIRVERSDILPIMLRRCSFLENEARNSEREVFSEDSDEYFDEDEMMGSEDLCLYDSFDHIEEDA